MSENRDCEVSYVEEPKRGYPRSIFLDDGEHGLEVEHMNCQEEDGSVTWDFSFTILGNHAALTEHDAEVLMLWLRRMMKTRQATGVTQNEAGGA